MSNAPTSSFGKWMALTAALLGWLFDGLEMGLFPLVARPALRELLQADGGAIPDKAVLDAWSGIITAFFLVGAATGGVLFGWLGDRFGRVRAMMLSVLTYALVSGLCGFATSAWQIGILRFIAALGMGGEWSLGVALINEIWPDRSRAFLAGLIGAAANVGYLLIAIVGIGLNRFVEPMRGLLMDVGIPQANVDHLLSNEGWRFLMMLGALPALLTFMIRMFVPESAKWEQEREKGTTSHWAGVDLFGVLIGSLGACGIIALWIPNFDLPLAVRVAGSILGFVVALVGYTYPVYVFLRRSEEPTLPVKDRAKPTFRRMLLGACLSGVALLGTWGSSQQVPYWVGSLANPEGLAHPKEYAQIASAAGAVVGTIIAALLGGWLGRRITYFLLCVASMAVMPAFFLGFTEFGTTFLIAVFGVGAITASFYGWLPLYLPEIFRTSVRATGQGFGFNFGRILAAIGVLQIGNLSQLFAGGLPHACASFSLIYLLGMVVIWFMPETKGSSISD